MICRFLVSRLLRLYPLYSGCGTLANLSIIHKITGKSDECLVAKVPGGKVLAPLNDYVGRAAYFVGELDRKITWICRRIVRPGDTVLDIGANIGFVTVLLSSLVGKDGNVYAFEPNPRLYHLLEKTLKKNQSTNIHLFQIAIGNVQRSMDLRIPKNNAGAASLVRNRDERDCEVVQVPVRRLSDIISDEGIQSIRFIKIDVEGFEAEVFRGGLDALKEIRPEAILFEQNEVEGAIRDQPAIKILQDLDYSFFSIPKCLFQMRLEYFDPNKTDNMIGHDLLAVYHGHSYNTIVKQVNATSK